MGELEGKVAIVTGAGRLRGIGRGASVALARLGADVVPTGTGRDPATFPPDEKEIGWRDMESTADQVRELGRRALPLVLDVADAASVDTMVERVLDEFGRIDILVSNAAYARGPDRKSTLDLDEAIFQKVQDVKVLGLFLLSRAIGKVLIDQEEGGKIVVVSSGSGKMGGAHSLAYNAACFAQVGMTQSLAHEFGPYGINVNCVCPGSVDTSRVDDLGRGETWQKLVDAIPVRRAGTDDELGGFIAYLCTEAASWIHGQSINMNGGQWMSH